MFDFDSLREIFSTIQKNKMRTFLTGFAVAWGIFMLIVLLAAGNGLKNGVMSNFAGRAKNAVTMYQGQTTMPYKGMPTKRRVRFTQRDLDMLKARVPEIENISAASWRTVTLSYKEEYISLDLEGTTDEGAYINNITVDAGNGRFINKMDMEDRRKTIVLHPDHIKVLFKDEDPIGKYVIADKIAYQVVGIYTDESFYSNPDAYIPLSTAQMLYDRGYGFYKVEFTALGLNTLAENKAFEERLRVVMGGFHTFDPLDRSALYINNSGESAIQAQQIFSIITIFIIIVGIASLMAGIVGVGNIMLVTVKERTREIGIRKSIGASPTSVLWLIIFEAIFITTCAGYVGIVMGVGLTELISMWMEGSAVAGERRTFLNPTVDLGTVILATLFLIVCGVIAGAIPAYKATRISPIEAMRAEN